ncbi:MAG: hypothetical protein R2741_05360 [Methanolobus sp.]
MIILFALAHQLRDSITQEYGFIAALATFILVISVVGIKLNDMQ